MGLNETPVGERIHIAFFGRRNAGKSSLVNAITGQDTALVSDIPGTTTDPVLKSMELLPLGPIVLIDTPGIDDSGALGELRVMRTKRILNKTDIAVLVIDSAIGKTETEEDLITIFIQKKINYIIAWNKSDRLESPIVSKSNEICISALTGDNIHSLIEKIASLSTIEEHPRRLVGDLLAADDFVLLVTPIDSAAPKGRLILPQQQTIRDILDSGATAIIVKETGLKQTLNDLGRKPNLVITDSQVFAQVNALLPHEIPLTSFSILFSRYKGTLNAAAAGAFALDRLRDGDRVLIAEGCTHRKQCGDIGTVKLPCLIRKHTQSEPEFVFSSGNSFPEDVSPYKLILHCGGCMLNEREMSYRSKCAADSLIPMTNYGIAIAYMQGILERSIELFDLIVKNPLQ